MKPAISRRAFLAWGASLPFPTFAVSSARRIPVLCYHSWMQTGCSYTDNALKALEADLETLYSRGWTVVPLKWVAEWVVGDRDGSTMPEKVVAITLDDGPYWDWYDYYYSPRCEFVPSAYLVLYRFKQAHPELPSLSPQATLFVIASRAVRESAGTGSDDAWWWLAQNTPDGLTSVQNHGYSHRDFTLLTASEARAEVKDAATYIAGVTGVWPILFAFPYGKASEDALEYLSNPGSGTYAAFCTGGKAATQKSDRYCIPRFVYGDLYWRTREDFIRYVLGEEL